MFSNISESVSEDNYDAEETSSAGIRNVLFLEIELNINLNYPITSIEKDSIHQTESKYLVIRFKSYKQLHRQ